MKAGYYGGDAAEPDSFTLMDVVPDGSLMSLLSRLRPQSLILLITAP